MPNPSQLKKKHKPQVRSKMTIYKMIVSKMIQFARLQATNENAKNGKTSDLKELSRPHKLLQGALAKSVKGGVKVNETCLPSIGPLCLSKVLK